MSIATLIDRADVGTTAEAGARLRTTMAAVRVSFTWFGVRKSLTPPQKARAAESFDADGGSLSAAKKLIDAGHPAFRAVTAIRGRIEQSWRSQSLPFPEPGVRLIRQEQVEPFARQVDALRGELRDAVAELDRRFDELKGAARQKLGSLYDEDDYPASLGGLYDVACDFPSVEPPAYLVALSPRLYEQERARASARFEEAVRLAEEAFLGEFGRLVAHLRERLGGADGDGDPKVFRDSAVGNLTEFFERFRRLNVRSNAQLDALVDEARRIVRGVGPQDLRDDASLRRHVASELSRVQSTLDGLLVDRPRRRILRGPVAKEAS
jgi:hypothetical protein